MRMRNVLVTFGSGWVGLVGQLKQAMRTVPALRDGQLLVADRAALTPAGCFADAAVRVPEVASPAYVDHVLDLCRTRAVRVLVPHLDLDLDRLAPHLGRFAGRWSGRGPSGGGGGGRGCDAGARVGGTGSMLSWRCSSPRARPTQPPSPWPLTAWPRRCGRRCRGTCWPNTSSSRPRSASTPCTPTACSAWYSEKYPPESTRWKASRSKRAVRPIDASTLARCPQGRPVFLIDGSSSSHYPELIIPAERPTAAFPPSAAARRSGPPCPPRPESP